MKKSLAINERESLRRTEALYIKYNLVYRRALKFKRAQMQSRFTHVRILDRMLAGITYDAHSKLFIHCR